MYRAPGYTGFALFHVSACSGVGQTGIHEFILWLDPQASMQNKLALIVVLFYKILGKLQKGSNFVDPFCRSSHNFPIQSIKISSDFLRCNQCIKFLNASLELSNAGLSYDLNCHIIKCGDFHFFYLRGEGAKFTGIVLEGQELKKEKK